MTSKLGTNLLCIVKFTPYPVDILYALCGVVVPEYLRVELAQPLRLIFCQRVSTNERVDLVHKPVVRLLVFLRLGELPRQPDALLNDMTPCARMEPDLLVDLG